MQLATEEHPVFDVSSAWIAAESQADAVSRTPEELANIVAQFASSDGWMDGAGAASHRTSLV
jgi:hypothetical protein